MMKFHLVLVLIVITAAIVLSPNLPWWGATLLVSGTLLFVFYATVLAIKARFRGTIRESLELASMALRGATITVHGVAHAPPPPSHEPVTEEEESEAGDLVDSPEYTPDRYIAVDMTVQPVDESAALIAPGGFREEDGEDEEEDVRKTWNPHTFTLAPIDSTIDPSNIRLTDFAAMQAAVTLVEHLDVDGSVLWSAPAEEDAGESPEPEPAAYPYQVRGPIRLRVTFGIPKQMPARAKLRYLLEEFTQISIPPV